MSSFFISLTTLADSLESYWQQYRATGNFTLFVEFTVSLNGLIEHLTRRRISGLARTARELESMALTLFGDTAQHPLPPDLTIAIERRLFHLLDELHRHEALPPPNRRSSDSPGDDAADPYARDRNVLIIAAAEHPRLESLCGQLASFGFPPSVTPWTELAAGEQAPLAILFLPEPPDVYPDDAANAISELRKRFPSSHIYCLAVPVKLESIVRFQRAGADTCIPVTSGGSDILARLLDLTREDEPETDRVLLVDDSQTAAFVTHRALSQHGIDSLAVADPRHLLEVAAGYRPDAILMDMHMPFCSGVEVTAALRQFAEYQALPVIYLSSETDIAQQIEALRLGGDQFLTKPVNPVVLAAVVKTKIARYREMRHSSQHDGLTRLLNHTTAKMRIGQSVAEIPPGGRLVVAMLDIDRFKNINDTWGHPVGDQVIRNLAWLLRGRLRGSDLIGRYGGEEFIVALPDTDLADAVNQLDRIREGFSALPHAHGTGTIHATFSCGVAALADHPSAEELIGAADAALLQAKRDGRNRVTASIAGMQMEEAAGGEL